MESVYGQSISNYLEHLNPLEPIATDVAEKLRPSIGAKAVVFDIYGTLLISASGDIDQAEVRNQYIDQALVASGIVAPADFSRVAFFAYKSEIKKQHLRAHKRSVAHPEINVVSIWRRVFIDSGIVASEKEVKAFAFMFELQSNPVFPMPGMAKVLTRLSAKGIPMGIVSNAQFYTLPILHYFIDGTLCSAGQLPLFDNRLCSFSFKQKVAKPDLRLFKKVCVELSENYGIEPNECLYVGNDMLRDIYPAQKVGFKTVLYAGDRRSLRLRPEHRNVVGIIPDYIITKLDQIFEILGATELFG